MTKGTASLALLPCRKTWDIVATPILRIHSSPPERKETGMRPIGYASHPSVFYRVPMDIIHETIEVGLITDEMFPNTALP